MFLGFGVMARSALRCVCVSVLACHQTVRTYALSLILSTFMSFFGTAERIDYVGTHCQSGMMALYKSPPLS